MKVDSKNILFLCSWFPHPENPTLGNFIERHAEAIGALHHVKVLHVYNSLKAHSITPIKGKNYTGVSIGINASGVFKYLKYFKAYSKGLKLLYKNKLPDLIHVNVLFPAGIFALFLKFKMNIPYLITEHWTGYLTGNENALSYYFVHQLIANNANVICPVSENLGNEMKKKNIGNVFQKIPNVVDTDLFNISTASNSKKKLIHISTLNEEQKNVSGILNVIKKLSEKRNDFEFHIISDGDESWAKSFCQQNNLTNQFVFFHGKKELIEVATLLANSDLLLLFSNYENLPCVISEAGACGIPVISTNVGGVSEMLNPNNGFLIEKGNENQLEASIIKFLDEPNQFSKEVIRKFALENYSEEEVAKQYTNIYNRILTKKHE